MKKFTAIPATPEVKERVGDLRYDMRVNSMDDVLRELLRVYDQESGRDTADGRSPVESH